jgi:hypothetical protein
MRDPIFLSVVCPVLSPEVNTGKFDGARSTTTGIGDIPMPVVVPTA